MRDGDPLRFSNARQVEDETIAEVSLLDGFEIRLPSGPVALPMSVQRLIALVALHDRMLPRTFAAGMLWPETSDERASGNLRTALWRLARSGVRIIGSNNAHLWLASDTVVDYREIKGICYRLLESSSAPSDTDVVRVCRAGDLLPGWYQDDFVLLEAERFRQLRVHCLETACRRLVAEGRYSLAVEAGRIAVSVEPLRESAHVAFMGALLSHGNQAEALRRFEEMRRRLADELGIEPSITLREIADGISSSHRHVTQR